MRRPTEGLKDHPDHNGHLAHYNFLPNVPLPPRIPDNPIPISEMAELFGVTHRTLHFYEEKKLLWPERIGTMRIYPQGQIRVMAVVNLCREIGMPVSQIQDLMMAFSQAQSQAECDETFKNAIALRRSELIADESLIRRQMHHIGQILESYETDAGLVGNDNLGSRHPILNAREAECLRHMAEGHTTVRIARELSAELSEVLELEKTIIQKFSASNRFQAIAKAVLLGLVPHQ